MSEVDSVFRTLFPRYWRVDPNQIAIVEIYVNWLLQEVDREAQKRWPILRSMRGWRRSEVIAFLETMPDWTDGVLNTKMEV